jgi:hypothetical protein
MPSAPAGDLKTGHASAISAYLDADAQIQIPERRNRVADEITVDVILGTIDADTVAPIEAELRELAPSRADPTRELVTILTVSAAAITLANKLVELWNSAHAKPQPPSITIEVESGATLNLDTVQTPDEIQRFLETHSQG